MINQLSLPYIEIKTVATRTYLRDNYKRGDQTTYQIPFSDLKERHGFNDRTVYEGIEELCISIMKHGLEIPLTVDVVSSGEVYLHQGHRRYRAIKMAREKDASLFEFVECYVNSNNVTELDRVVKNYTSNNLSRHLKPLEQASSAFKIKYSFGEEKSNEEVASLMGVSRQTVDNLINIAQCSDELKNEIKIGNLSLTAAISFLRNQKKIGKQKDIQEINSHKTSEQPPTPPKDGLSQELKELEELQKAETPEEKQLRESLAVGKAIEALMLVSDEIKTSKLQQHIGRRLSQAAIREWTEDFMDEDTGEVVPVERKEILAREKSIITEEVAVLLAEHLKTVFVYKKGMEPVAESVITEPKASKEKSKYDVSRLEIQQINNCITISDKIESVINKLDVPEGTKKDISSYVQWLQKDLAECREYIHKHKDQNKRGR